MNKKSSEWHLFEMEIFCNIINVSTDTFDEFNATLLNKSNNSFKKKNLNYRKPLNNND